MERGPPGDFKHWKQLGVYGWDYYEHILPAFKKSEKYFLKFKNRANFHGKKGIKNPGIPINFLQVILSAGTFHSPQLLMHSGIGPRHALKKPENSTRQGPSRGC